MSWLRDGAVGRAGAYLPAAIVVAIWVVGAYLSGGYFARDWYPAAIALVVLLAVVVFFGGRAVPENRVVRLALLLLAGVVAWSYLSMLWSGSPGPAWEASNKLLVYLVTAWLLALVPWDRGSAAVLVAAWSLGIAGVCLISLLGAVEATEFSGFMYAFRFQDPIGYTNANAALAIMAALPALALAYQRRLHVALQGLLLACTTFLIEFSLLTQSRAAALGGVIVLVLFIAAAPDRLRLLGRLAIVAAAVGLAAPTLLDVYSTAKAGGSVEPVIDDSAVRMAWTTLLAGLLGAALGVFERSLRPGTVSRRGVRAAQVGAVALTVVAAGALVVSQGGRFVDFVGDEFQALNGESSPRQESTRYTKTTLYERPDYWRVSLDMFAERPVAGFGSGNFEREYTARRDEPKYSRFAHNLWLRAAAEWGAVGLGLLLGFAAVAFGAPLLRLRRLDADTRGVVVGCLAVTAYFFVHASFDWLEEVPALAAPALALAVVAIAVARPDGTAQHTAPTRGWWRAAAVAGPAVFVLLALAALVPPYLSLRHVERASEAWQADPAGAFERLDRAADLNPLSAVPPTTEGTIAVSLGQNARARSAFRDSLDVEESWYPHLELALLDAEGGRYRAAGAEIARARELSRSDPFIAEAEERIRRREPIDASDFNAGIAEQTRAAFVTRQK